MVCLKNNRRTKTIPESEKKQYKLLSSDIMIAWLVQFWRTNKYENGQR